MKTGITYIARTNYEQVLAEKNIPFTVKSGFIRAGALKGRGPRVYVPTTKRVGVVYLSDWEAPLSIAQVPDCGQFSTVKQSMRMEGDESEVMFRFAQICDLMVEAQAAFVKPTRAKVEKIVTEAPIEKTPEELAQIEAEKTAKREADKARRAALIAKVAAEKGVSVSPQAQVA